jgi:hypothetical protein
MLNSIRRKTWIVALCLGLSLGLGLLMPATARADDTDDYINQIYQDQQQTADYLKSIDDTNQYVDQIYKDQQAQTDYLNQIMQNAQPPGQQG